MLKPLHAGNHTIHFHAVSGGFALDVTYKLHIAPGDDDEGDDD